jgi:hypothetical protein
VAIAHGRRRQIRECRSRRHGLLVGVAGKLGLDAPGKLVDRLGELGDRRQGAVLAPPAAYATDSPATSRPTPEQAGWLAVSAITSARSRPSPAYPTPSARIVSWISVRKRALAGRAESTTIRLCLVSHQPPSRPIELLEADDETERLRERLHRDDQASVRVAGQPLAGRLERRVLDPVDRRDLSPGRT